MREGFRLNGDSVEAGERRTIDIPLGRLADHTRIHLNNAWGELDMRASIFDPQDIWEIAFFLSNATDNRHVTAVTALGGFPNAAINEPRKWGADVSVRYSRLNSSNSLRLE